MSDNEHYQAARMALDEGYNNSDFKGDISRDAGKLLALIQVQATLALAYEQRTANMLESLNWGVPGPKTPDLLKTIADRMGFQ